MAANYILDACAALAFLNDEDGADEVQSLLRDGDSGISNLYMNSLNLLEVYYGLLRDDGKEAAKVADQTVRSLPVSLISELDDEIFYKAGYFKATYHISFADSILLGTANRFNATVVTADHHELDSVEAAGEASFLWIR